MEIIPAVTPELRVSGDSGSNPDKIGKWDGLKFY
jgi:hypothetical protein